MKIDIEISGALNGKFSQVRLCYSDTDQNVKKVELDIDFLPLYDFSKDTSSVRFDFFLISALVYGIDNLISRQLYSVDGWAREIEVEFPVNNLVAWKSNEELLETTLKFLTGDYWTVSFVQRGVRKLFVEKYRRWSKNRPVYIRQDIKKVSLFSGGLDSLIGVIDSLEGLLQNDKILFVSHFDSHSVGPNSDQTNLYRILKEDYEKKIYWIQSTITLSRNDVDNQPVVLEDSYRSRSFLFIGIGLFLLTPSVSANELIIPENGTISLNYPLTPSRVSSLSTRTTHPFVLNMIQELITKVLDQKIITNPYTLFTKGEMVQQCMNLAVLSKSYSESVSCGKRGRRNHWDIKSGTEHCGVCMPCIYRRAALNKEALDIETYGIDILNAASIDSYVDIPALFDYLNTDLSNDKIKRDLLVNGSLPMDKLDDYAAVVSRSRAELLNWFNEKGNNYIKTELGLQ